MVKTVRLPVRARDYKRIVRRLEPEPWQRGLHALRVCRGLGCSLCLFHEKPETRVRRKLVSDPLSGLTMRLPIVEARYCGVVLWRAYWRRGLLTVDELRCPAVLEGERVSTPWGEVRLEDAARVLSMICGR